MPSTFAVRPCSLLSSFFVTLAMLQVYPRSIVSVKSSFLTRPLPDVKDYGTTNVKVQVKIAFVSWCFRVGLNTGIFFPWSRCCADDRRMR